MKILFQTRPNAFTQRGGDTICLERLSSNLSDLGVGVKIDCDGKADLQQFDCLFLFNFTLPQLLRQQAFKAQQAGIPYVVLTLNEDIPSFHAQSHMAAASLINYLKAGQPAKRFSELYSSPWKATPAARFENEWVARNAAILFTTGERESAVLKQYYPGLANVSAMPIGFDPMAEGSAASFEAEFGVRDFILSVGRIESRKNQLMLLKALEAEDMAVVIASGGFTYQPDYDWAVRNFKRRGKTVILDKLTPAQLASAYAAARIHALPSWYELPGLVSMEAASVGKNVVVSDMGTTRDYFNDEAFYSDPGCPDSIKNAVLAAFYSPLKVNARDNIMQFTWHKAAQHVLDALRRVISVKPELELNSPRSDKIVVASNLSLSAIIQQAEDIARTGQFEEALDFIIAHREKQPGSSALWRATGMLLLAMKRNEEAGSALQRALRLDPYDSRILCGLGICASQVGEHKQAHDLFVRSLSADQNNKIAILQLLSVSYELNSFEELEIALKNYLSENKTEIDLSYALAGCLYRQGKFPEALRYCEEILKQHPGHEKAIELSELVNKADVGVRAANQESKAVALEKEPGHRAAEQQKLRAADSKTIEAILKITEMKRSNKISQGLQEIAKLLGNLSADCSELEEIYALQGEMMALNGQLVEAEQRFNSLLVQFPNSSRAICGLGALYAEKGNWDKAQEYFRRAVSVNTQCDVGYAGLALSSLQANDKEAAWHYYDKALELNPENLRAVFGILELGYQQARYSDVERVLKNYLELHPANIDFIYSLAGCFFAQNRFSEASSEVEKILIFSPEHQKANELRRAIKDRLEQRNI